MTIDGITFHPAGPGAAEGTHAFAVTLVLWEGGYHGCRPPQTRSYQGTCTPGRGCTTARIRQAVLSYALTRAQWSGSRAEACVPLMWVERNRVARPWWRVFGGRRR